MTNGNGNLKWAMPFGSLCNLMQGKIERENWREFAEEAVAFCKEKADEEDMLANLGQPEYPNEYPAEPFPSHNPNRQQGPPAHCPMCGADVKQKSGISKKTGKPYSFIGCGAFPECRWVFKN